MLLRQIFVWTATWNHAVAGTISESVGSGAVWSRRSELHSSSTVNSLAKVVLQSSIDMFVRTSAKVAIQNVGQQLQHNLWRLNITSPREFFSNAGNHVFSQCSPQDSCVWSLVVLWICGLCAIFISFRNHYSRRQWNDFFKLGGNVHESTAKKCIRQVSSTHKQHRVASIVCDHHFILPQNCDISAWIRQFRVNCIWGRYVVSVNVLCFLNRSLVNSTVLRYVELVGSYLCDVPLQIPSLTILKLNGTMHTSDTNLTNNITRFTAMVELNDVSFSGVVGGTYNATVTIPISEAENIRTNK